MSCISGKKNSAVRVKCNRGLRGNIYVVIQSMAGAQSRQAGSEPAESRPAGHRAPSDTQRRRLLDAVPLLHAGVAVVVCRTLVLDRGGRRGRGGHAPKLRSGLHEQWPAFHRPAPLGQCTYGLCSYPMSSKKWIWSFFAKSAAAMLCTGASPQRCAMHVVSGEDEQFGRELAHLVVESAGGVEVVEVLHVGLAAPEVHVGDFEVAPDCIMSINRKQ